MKQLLYILILTIPQTLYSGTLLTRVEGFSSIDFIGRSLIFYRVNESNPCFKYKLNEEEWQTVEKNDSRIEKFLDKVFFLAQKNCG